MVFVTNYWGKMWESELKIQAHLP